MSDIFSFPDITTLPAPPDVTDSKGLTQAINQAINSKPVKDAIDVAMRSAVLSGPAAPWRTFAWYSPAGGWTPGTIIAVRGKQYHVKLDAISKPKWFSVPDVLPYYYRYSPRDTLATKPKIWLIKTGSTKTLNIMVTEFASNKANIPFDAFVRINKILTSTLRSVTAPTIVHYSVFGFTDDVGGKTKNNKLAKLRATKVLGHVKAVADAFVDKHRRAMRGKTFAFRHNQKATPKASAIAIANPLEKPVRSNPDFRPNMRSVIITFQIVGASNFVGRSGGPKKEDLVKTIRGHLDAISTEPNRKLARLATVMLNEKHGSHFERYIEDDSFGVFSKEYKSGMRLSKWFAMGRGKSCWTILLDGARAKHDLNTIRATLKEILKDLTDSRKRAKNQAEQGHGKGFAVDIMGWITATKDRGVYGALYRK